MKKNGYISSENSTQTVYKKLKQLIDDNQLVAGEKIFQEKFAKDFGVSRTPVIKALNKLESEGFVDNIPDRGFYIHVLKVRELYELLIMREAMDGVVAKYLAKNRTEEQSQALLKIWEPFDISWNSDKFQDKNLRVNYIIADRQFHKCQYEWCNFEILKKISSTSQILSRTFLAGSIRSENKTLMEHLEIANAIAECDPKMAGKAAAHHNAQTVEMLEDAINKLKAFGIDAGKLALDVFENQYLYRL